MLRASCFKAVPEKQLTKKKKKRTEDEDMCPAVTEEKLQNDSLASVCVIVSVFCAFRVMYSNLIKLWM